MPPSKQEEECICWSKTNYVKKICHFQEPRGEGFIFIFILTHIVGLITVKTELRLSYLIQLFLDVNTVETLGYHMWQRFGILRPNVRIPCLSLWFLLRAVKGKHPLWKVLWVSFSGAGGM